LRFISVALLVVVALACVAGNVCVTSKRTLIPDAYDVVLVSKERRTEKHPGLDDVVIWHLGDGRAIQVDPAVDELFRAGHRVRKSAGRAVSTSDPAKPPPTNATLVAFALMPTRDSRGMFLVAGPALLSTGLLAWAAIRRRRRAPPSVVS